MSGFSRTRGLLLALALAFLKAGRVALKARVGWCWRVRRIWVEGGPRGRRKVGIGVGILICLDSFFLPGVRLLSVIATFVDAEFGNFWRGSCDSGRCRVY